MVIADTKLKSGEPFMAYVVAIDVVAFSRNSENDLNLFKDRAALFRAVADTAIFKKCPPFGQFLGDELRLAFPTGGAEYSDFHQFIQTIFRNLDEIGEAPTIRVALTREIVKILYLRDCFYLTGKAIDDVQDALQAAEEGAAVAILKLTGWDEVSLATGRRAWSRKFSARTTDRALNYDALSDSNGPNAFVVALAVKKVSEATLVRDTNQTLAGLVDDAIKRSMIEANRLLFSVGPSAMLLAIIDDDADRTMKFVLTLRDLVSSSAKAMPITMAISSGAVRPIKEDWLSHNFEGKPAIVACRISAHLSPFDVGLCSQAQRLLLNITPQAEEIFLGKREEKFAGARSISWLHVKSKMRASGPAPSVSQKNEIDHGLELSPAVVACHTQAELNKVAPTDIYSSALASLNSVSSQERAALLDPVIAVTFSGLRLGADGSATNASLSRNTPTAVSHSIYFFILHQEIPMWKEFHSLTATFRNRCNLICAQLSGRGKWSEILDQIRQSVDRGTASEPDWHQSVSHLKNYGIKPLLDSISQSMSQFGMVIPTALFERLVNVPYMSVDECDEDLRSFGEHLNKLYDKLIGSLAACPPRIRRFAEQRFRASRTALDCGFAVLLVARLFHGNEQEHKAQVESVMSERGVFTRIRSALDEKQILKVVDESNAVIYGWIDVMNNG